MITNQKWFKIMKKYQKWCKFWILDHYILKHWFKSADFRKISTLPNIIWTICSPSLNINVKWQIFDSLFYDSRSLHGWMDIYIKKAKKVWWHF